MINNNPYNIPEKKPLSQSKIFSDTNTSRHSSTYLQNRNGNEVMYNSSIFLKNPSVNGPCDQSFFQPTKQPLSPHHAKYSKPPSNIQFVPSFNHPTIRPPQPHFFPISVPKQVNLEKSVIELRQKIEKIEKRMQAKEKKELTENHVQNKKLQNFPQVESVKSLTEDSITNNSGLKQLVSLMIEETLEAENKKVWQKFTQLQESISFSINKQVGEKLSALEESFFRLQSEKPIDQHLINRLKTIEKTIREMGEDIHLVNDKEESLSTKIQIDFPAMKNEMKNLKAIQKKVVDQDKKFVDHKLQIDQLNKKLKTLELMTQKNLQVKIKDIETKIQTLKSQQKDIKPTFQRYLSEPCMLKYIQKYQVSKPHTNYHSYSSSTKEQSCEEIVINEITYFIDHEGYLLDNDRYYLTNSFKNERIRLDQKHIEVLRERKILI